MKLLDLFCGAGGAAYGYHLAGFDDIVGVDIKPQPHYPFEFVQADALEYVAEYGQEFDVIHASPPCQRFSQNTREDCKENHPDLIEPTRQELLAIGKPYIIENVTGARKHLKIPFMLCGSMFGLSMWRHRYFEIWPRVLFLTPPCAHSFVPVNISSQPMRFIDGKRVRQATIAEKREAMRIDWMTCDEITEAIPPAYTEWIGQRLL